MRRRDLLGGLSLVPLAAPAVAQCVVATFPRINLPGRCEGGGGIEPPALDLDFMTPGTLDPRITFTRASTATYFNSAGIMQTAATNAPRWDYDPATLQLRGLLIEEARTNLLLNSATLGTQSVTVTAVAHTLSFTGTGTITKSGTATGALVGTGATQRVSQIFTPTAGSLTLTVTGTVSNAQIEAGAFATSYIATAGAAATRVADVATVSDVAWYNSSAGTLATEAIIPQAAAAGTQANIVRLDDTTNTNALNHFVSSAGAVFGSATVGGVSQINSSLGATITSAVDKAGSTYGGGQLWRYSRNGALANGIGSAVPFVITRMMIGNGSTTQGLWKPNGFIRRIRYWSRTMTDAEFQAVTT